MSDQSEADDDGTRDGPSPMAGRFRGFLPVVVDVETGGFDAQTDALLELAAVFVSFDADQRLVVSDSMTVHLDPFEGANIEPAALEFNGIDPTNPLRGAVSECDHPLRLVSRTPFQVLTQPRPIQSRRDVFRQKLLQLRLPCLNCSKVLVQ